MYSLLINNCIKHVALETDSDGQNGEIYFYNGETYIGDIHNNKPYGTGKLIMNDGSYYEGEFDNEGITEGVYFHCSSNVYEGSFLRDRFKKGKIVFCDGDVLEGEWGLIKSKWGLKWGVLRNEEGNEIGRLNSSDKKGLASIKSGFKEIHRSFEKMGFCVSFEKINSDTKDKLLFTAEGTSIDESRQSENWLSKIVRKTNIQLPFSQIDHLLNNCIQKSILNLCYGIQIESQKEKEEACLSFNGLKEIKANGSYEFSKLKFKFEGKLSFKNTYLGVLFMKKTSFTQLHIKLDEKEFDTLSDFCKHVNSLCITKLNENVIREPEQRSKHKKSIKSKETMQGIIKDIKDGNECVIM